MDRILLANNEAASTKIIFIFHEMWQIVGQDVVLLSSGNGDFLYPSTQRHYRRLNFLLIYYILYCILASCYIR
jgi:hypothetical protein